MALPLESLLRGITYHRLGAPPPPWVSEIRTHSAAVGPGDVFVAVPGHRFDGARFVREAVRRGARMVVSEVPPPAGTPLHEVTWLMVPSARAALSRLAANRYGRPSTRLRVTGVTGTTGKTTTALLLRHLLAASGRPAGLIGSLAVDTGLRRLAGGLTTPDPLDLHGYVDEMVRAGLQEAVVEVSSQGVDQARVNDVDFDLGVVTNLAPLEHLEYHAGYQDYVAAKARFVAMIPPRGALLMGEGEAYARLAPAARAPVVIFGRSPASDVRLAGEGIDGWTTRLYVTVQRPLPGAGEPFPAGPLELRTQLLGPHHAANVLAAVTAALCLGVSPEEIAAALPLFPPPRRRTQVLMREPFTVIDDTAGHPDSIAAALEVAAALPHRRIVVVYAVRGGRGVEVNAANGSVLAREAGRLGAAVIVTASQGDTAEGDTVRPEEWQACIGAMAAAGMRPALYPRLPDAVAAGLKPLRDGDLLLLLGAQGMDRGAAYLHAMLAPAALRPAARAGVSGEAMAEQVFVV
ncbi:MAG TPA: Mur ligase family protein [Thermaerobacter sp.]